MKVRPFTSHVKMMTLTLVLPHADRWFYPREIQQITGIAYTPVRTSLISLCKGLGLVKQRTQGKRQFYSIDKDFFLYEEYKRIVLKTTGLADHLRWRQKKKDDIIAAFVYGDFAEGTESTATPIRFAVIGNISRRLVEEACRAAAELTLKSYEFELFTPTAFTQQHEEKDPAVRALLKGPSIYMIGRQDVLTAPKGA